jgi:hypothetical protein
LNFNVTGPFEETLDEDSSIAKCGLGLRNCPLECILKLGFFAHNTHATTSTAHSGLDDH